MKKDDGRLNLDGTEDSEAKTMVSSMKRFSRSVDFEARETNSLAECFGEYVKSGTVEVFGGAEVAGDELANSGEENIDTALGKMSTKSLEDVLVGCINGDEKATDELRDFVEWGSIYCVKKMRLWKVISDFVADNIPKKEMTPEVRRAAQALKMAYARFSVYAFLVGFVDALRKVSERDDVHDMEKCIADLFEELDAKGIDEAMSESADGATDVEPEDDAEFRLCDEIIEEWSGYVDQYGYITL